MRRLLLFSISVILFSLAGAPGQKAMASHAAGGELLYEWVSGSTYKLIFKFYRDCSGISEPASQQVCYFNSCNSTTGTVTLQKITSVGNPVLVPCIGSQLQTTCNGGSIPGYLEWIYEGTVTLPTQCDFWTFRLAISARNPQNNIAAGYFYCEATLNNAYAQGNSSPTFSVKPVPYVCVNIPYVYNNGAIDINNDSLVFEMMQPICAAASCPGVPNPAVCAWNAAQVPPMNIIDNPLQTNNSFSINTATGALSFTPSILQTSTIATRVKEYRNNVLIGTVMRDIQVIVRQCNIPQPTITMEPNSMVNCQYINDRIEACAGLPFSFCWDAVSSDTSIDLNVSDNSLAVMPTSNVTYIGQSTDSVRGCLSWAPTSLDTGLKIFVINVQACSPQSNTPPITQSFTIPIYIWPITEIFPDTTICQGSSVNLKAVGGSNFEWTVLPGGSPLSTLSCTSCDDPIATPTMTTQYVVTSNVNNFCNKNIDTVTITVVDPPVIDLGPDITTCIGETIQLDINMTPQPGVTYDIVWTPTTYLSAPNIANPTSTPLTDITYSVTVAPMSILYCARRDTINVRVLQGFTFYNNDTAICDGAVVQIVGTGEPDYTYSWSPVLGVSNPSIINPVIDPDTSRLYILTASYPGCKDSTKQIYIDVQPNPQVYIGPDQIICYGDTLQFRPVVTPLSYPNYSYNWDPSGSVDVFTNKDVIFTGYQSALPLIFTVTTPAGCLGSDDAIIEVQEAEFMTLDKYWVGICPGDTVTATVLGTAVNISWTPTEYMSDSTSYNPSFYPIVPTTYTVTGRDVENCLDTSSITIDVYPMGVLSVPDSVRIYPGESYTMDPKGNCLYFTWFPPTGLSNANIANPVAQPEVDTRYYVSASTEGGCIVTDSIDVLVSLDSEIDIPNAFTPGNAPNGTYGPVYMGTAKLKSFTIYNRWGTKVFESSNIENGWDGTYKGTPQPMGVYIYTIEAQSYRGRVFTKQGNFTLLR